MIWVTVAALALVIGMLWYRVVWLVDRVLVNANLIGFNSAHIAAISSREFHKMQHGIIEQEQRMHDMVIRCRQRGLLDKANKISELQRWADLDYEAHWLDGMFRGFP